MKSFEVQNWDEQLEKMGRELQLLEQLIMQRNSKLKEEKQLSALVEEQKKQLEVNLNAVFTPIPSERQLPLRERTLIFTLRQGSKAILEELKQTLDFLNSFMWTKLLECRATHHRMSPKAMFDGVAEVAAIDFHQKELRELERTLSKRVENLQKQKKSLKNRYSKLVTIHSNRLAALTLAPPKDLFFSRSHNEGKPSLDGLVSSLRKTKDEYDGTIMKNIGSKLESYLQKFDDERIGSPFTWNH